MLIKLILLGILAHEKILFVILDEIINKIKFDIYYLSELKAVISYKRFIKRSSIRSLRIKLNRMLGIRVRTVN